MGFKLSNISLTLDGNHILKNISMEVDEGDFVCLLGPSGCGKTTSLRILAGLETPDTGSVYLNERLVNDQTTFLPPEKRQVGFLFQDFALFPHLNIEENIAFGLTKGPDNQDRITEMLDTVQLGKHGKTFPHMLSGGQQQRVALARALAPNPDIMLLDEPFSGLDTSLRMDIRAQTRSILKDNKITTVMVTHDPEEAMYMADKIVLMNEGKIVQIGTPTELYNNPSTEFCATFLGDLHCFEGRVENNIISTPIGSFKTPEFNDNKLGRIFVRPECIEILPAQSDKPEQEGLFQLNSSHFMGDSSLLKLKHTHSFSHLPPLAIKTRQAPKIAKGDFVILRTDEKHILSFN